MHTYIIGPTPSITDDSYHKPICPSGAAGIVSRDKTGLRRPQPPPYPTASSGLTIQHLLPGGEVGIALREEVG